jgi:thiol-disulfide isomerase/thioredoxin
MNSDGSITINADTTFYFGSYNNIINKDVFQDSLSNGDYDVTFKNTPKGVEFRLKRKNLSKHSIFKLGQKIPELKLVDINQNEISVADNKKYTLLTFWDTTCKPCIEELISLNILANKYNDVCFIAITSASNVQIKNFFQERGFNWKNIKVVTDYPYFENFKINAVPFNIIIDNNNTIQEIISGKEINKIKSFFDANL